LSREKKTFLFTFIIFEEGKKKEEIKFFSSSFLVPKRGRGEKLRNRRKTRRTDSLKCKREGRKGEEKPNLSPGSADRKGAAMHHGVVG